jgi:hypothetical protein
MVKCAMMKKEILKDLKVKEGFVKGVLHVTKIIGIYTYIYEYVYECVYLCVSFFYVYICIYIYMYI